VCLSVLLSLVGVSFPCHIKNRTAEGPKLKFLYMLPMPLVRSSCGGVVICYVLPVCGWHHVSTL